jgi:hypothetical protein
MTFPRGEIVRLRARAFTLPISEVRVIEDGVSPSQPEAKCDWAMGGCSWAKFPRLCGKPIHRVASNQNREGQVLGVQDPTLLKLRRDSAVTGIEVF